MDSVDPLAEEYRGISPFADVANNPIVLFDPNGKEIRNSGGYVIQNPRFVKTLIQFNNALAEITGKHTSKFTMEVTGGDRYRTIIPGSEVNPASFFDLAVDRSRTNNSIVWKSDPKSPHLEKNGARGIDLSLPEGITEEQIANAAKEAGFTQVIFYKDGHFHLTLNPEDSKGKRIKDGAL